MKIAVASGKGGTGKTMIATSLAASLAPDYVVHFLDCDVEAPNAHLFLNPELTCILPAVIAIPNIDANICIACGKCVTVCQYNALAMIQKKILVFSQLCHGCGSCTLNCPVAAISEEEKTIGTLQQGIADRGIMHYMGKLTISEPMPSPIIHQLKKLPQNKPDITILDAPPGASCAVVSTVYDADFILLVTEPTPFGLHDLKQMLGIISQTGIPAGVIINRLGIGDKAVETFLTQTSIPIMMKIPYQREIAFGLASGKVLSDFMPVYRRRFRALFRKIEEHMKTCAGEPC
jgi:MinD superfamily P-loop ATPase